MLELFDPSFLCEKNLLIIVLPRDFCMYSFDDSTSSQNLRSCESISLKTILIFPQNFPNFRSDTIEKQDIINFSGNSSKSYASVVLWDFCCILTFDPAKHAISKWCTGRMWHITMASNRKKSRWRIWLTKWDKVKAHDTLINWCTWREWPLNCMIVISAWWRSNMPFQRLSGRLSGRWTII